MFRRHGRLRIFAMRKTTEIYSALFALIGAALVGAGIALAFTPAPVQQIAQLARRSLLDDFPAAQEADPRTA